MAFLMVIVPWLMLRDDFAINMSIWKRYTIFNALCLDTLTVKIRFWTSTQKTTVIEVTSKTILWEGDQKWRREHIYTMNIREKEIIYCFLFASRWQQIWLPFFTNHYCNRTNKLENCKSPKMCYSMTNKPLSVLPYHHMIINSYNCAISSFKHSCWV